MKARTLIWIWVIFLISFSIPGPAMAGDTAAPSGMRYLEVKAIDENGQPIEGVKIHRSVWTEAKFKPNGDEITDEAGTVKFELPQSVEIIRLWASKKGWVPLFANFDERLLGPDPVPDGFTFRMEKGTSVGGFVKDELGEPIQNARVEVLISGKESEGDGTTVFSRWLAFKADGPVTNENGFWRITNAPAGDQHRIGLRLSHPDYVDDLATEWHWFGGNSEHPFRELRTHIATAVMKKGAQVQGRITDPEGKPVPGAMIVWGEGPYHNQNKQEAFSVEDGTYRLPPISESTKQLTVVAKGFSPVLEKVLLKEGRQTIDFSLEPGHRMRIRFVDEQGKPVGGVGVNILGWRGTDSLFNWKHSNVPDSKIPNRAGKNGEYLWTWAPEDQMVLLMFKKGYREVRRGGFGPGDHQVVLQRE